MKIKNNISSPNNIFEFEIKRSGVFKIKLYNCKPRTYGDAIIIEQNGGEEIIFQKLQNGEHLLRLFFGAKVKVIIFHNDIDIKLDCKIENADAISRILNSVNIFFNKSRCDEVEIEPFFVHQEIKNQFQPSITVIIPTHNNPEYIIPLWQNILSKLIGGRTEIILINHNGSNLRCLALYGEMRKMGVRILDINCDFNFSYLINEGAKFANGEILLFMNDDIMPHAPIDLIKFANMHLQSGAMISGALLTYQDGRIQHMGVKYGLNGFVDHVGRFKLPKSFAYLPDFISTDAVTGALIAIKRDDFQKLSGFDEEMVVECNDIDLCERAKVLGGRIVVNCTMQFIHDESATRNKNKKIDIFTIQKINDRLLFFSKYWSKLI